MRTLLPILGAVLVVTSCAQPATGPTLDPVSANEEAFAQSRHAIIGGAYDPGDPAVVAFAVAAQSPTHVGLYISFCTATLIGPRTGLTAGHCSHPKEFALPDGGDDYHYYALFSSAAVGNSLLEPDGGQVPSAYFDCRSPNCKAVEVVNQVVHPDFINSPTQISGDVCVLELAQTVTDPGWISIYEDGLGPSDVGKQVRHVGFGQTLGGAANGDTFGYKRQATYLLNGILDDRIESHGDGHETCQGDSGGPTFLIGGSSRVERVEGIVSYGDSNCALFGYDSRVDFYKGFINSTRSAWEAAPSCLFDGYCVPNGCALADPDCRAFRDACSADALCASQHCWTDPQHDAPYCTRACAGAGDCPADMSCGSGGYCEYLQRSTAQAGASCTTADFCSGFDVCEGPSTGQTRCETPCGPEVDGGTSCPFATQTCQTGVNGRQYCRNLPKVQVAAASDDLGKTPGCSATGGVALAAIGALLVGLGRRQQVPVRRRR